MLERGQARGRIRSRPVCRGFPVRSQVRIPFNALPTLAPFFSDRPRV